MVKPVTVQVKVDAPVVHVPRALLLESYAVAVYPVTADPLIFTGASQLAVADAFDATAVTLGGADGAAFIEVALEALEADEVPTALVAVTLNV